MEHKYRFYFHAEKKSLEISKNLHAKTKNIFAKKNVPKERQGGFYPKEHKGGFCGLLGSVA